MPYQNPISPALHSIPDACPLCRDPIGKAGGRFSPPIADYQTDGGEWTAAHERCIQDPLHARMIRAFRLVRPDHDWRAAIDSHLTLPELDQADVSLEDVRNAIIYFTSTTPSIVPVTVGAYQVRAAGYRAGPAGP